jgi:hypothetical protein
MAVVAGEWEEGELAVPKRCKHCVVNGAGDRRRTLMSDETTYRNRTAYPASRKYSALVLRAVQVSYRRPEARYQIQRQLGWCSGKGREDHPCPWAATQVSREALTAPRVPAEKLSMKRTVFFSAHSVH